MFDCLSLPGREGHHGSLWTLHCDWLSSLHGGLWSAHGSSLHGPGLIIPTHEGPFLGCSISVYLVSTLPSPLQKNSFFFFLYFFFVFEMNFIFSEEFYLLILFLRALLSWHLTVEIFKKIMQKRKRKKTEWAQDKSFQNKN